MSRRVYIGCAFILIIGFIFFIEHIQNDHKRIKADYKVLLHKENEWRYDIYINDALFIRQNTIPALAGNLPIKDKRTAETLAREVVKKIERHENPSISMTELKEMGIKEASFF